jgi:hypothetical protein
VKNRDAITPDFIGFICREIALTAAIYCSLIQAANPREVLIRRADYFRHLKVSLLTRF